mmetsp:Transcript_1949/g.6101  ORF Transcript_1949/g.6101 Transcript_1949/m.6101 type:complete len:204 (-) Transcript_1949:461-1072(-)
MASASTSRPSASVFVISTVEPFNDRTMHDGMTAFGPTAFSASAKTLTKLTGSCKRAMASVIPNTAAAPIMSICIVSMLPNGFTLSPPVSMVTPFPTTAVVDLLFGFPLYSRTTKRGGRTAPCPTAARRLSPRLLRSFMRKSCRTVTLCFLFAVMLQSRFASVAKRSGLMTSGRQFPRSRAWLTLSATACPWRTLLASNWPSCE